MKTEVDQCMIEQKATARNKVDLLEESDTVSLTEGSEHQKPDLVKAKSQNDKKPMKTETRKASYVGHFLSLFMMCRSL